MNRAGIGLSFAAMTCWPMGTLAVDLPTWPMTDDEYLAYIDQFFAEFERPKTAPEYYATVTNPTRFVLEHVSPDLNGDGVEDYVLIDADATGLSANPGKVIIYSGWISLGTLHEFVSDEVGDSYASVVKGIDDIDGDLIDDFAIGAPLSDLGALNGGRVDVHSGATGALILRIVGNEANGRLGMSIDNAGDCNGDGINDLVIGEPHTDAVRGRAFVFYGADGLGAGGTVMRSPADADLSLTDGLAGAQFGFSVAGVGDVNGDGVPDLAVGSPNRSIVDPDNIDDGVTDRVGGLTVFTGSTGDRLFTVSGSVEDAWLGKASLGVADLDGDGFNELFFSAPGFPFAPGVAVDPAPVGPPTTDGHVYVLNSTDIAILAPNTVLTVADASYELARPAGASFQFGDTMEIGHDVNADGVDDILIYASDPVPVTIEELGGIDLAALGIPLTLPIFTLEVTSHVFSGVDGSAMYSFVVGDGSGVEINIPYPGPVVIEQVSQAVPFGDVTLDGVVDASDLSQTVASMGQPVSASPTTDVNQDGVTGVGDVEIVNAVLVAQQAEADCFQLVESGIYANFCECFEAEYPGIDPSGLGDPETPDCTGDDDPGPPTDGGDPPACEPAGEAGSPAGQIEECRAHAECVSNNEFDNDINNACDAVADARSQALDAVLAALTGFGFSDAAVVSDAAIAAATQEAEAGITKNLGANVKGDGVISIMGTAGGIFVTIALASNPITGTALLITVVGWGTAGAVGFLTAGGIRSENAHAQIEDARAGIEAAGRGDFANTPGIVPTGVSLASWNALINAGSAYSSARNAMISALRAALDLWMPQIKALEDAKKALEDAKEDRFSQMVLDCLDCFLNDSECTEYDGQ